MVFDPRHPTLAFIGMVRPLGPIMPLSELQCRWVARVLSGKPKLPSENEISADIEKYKWTVRARFYEAPRNTIEVDWIPYMDDVASLLGVKPNMLKFFFTDPALWARLTFGPSFPYQYRLDGSGKWSEARKTLFGTEERVRAAFQTKTRNVSSEQNENRVAQPLRIVFILLCALFIVLFATQR